MVHIGENEVRNRSGTTEMENGGAFGDTQTERGFGSSLGAARGHTHGRSYCFSRLEA